MFNQPCLSRLTFNNLNSNELGYYPFVVSLDRCNGTYNTFDNSPDRFCVKMKQKCKLKRI